MGERASSQPAGSSPPLAAPAEIELVETNATRIRLPAPLPFAGGSASSIAVKLARGSDSPITRKLAGGRHSSIPLPLAGRRPSSTPFPLAGARPSSIPLPLAGARPSSIPLPLAGGVRGGFEPTGSLRAESPIGPPPLRASVLPRINNRRVCYLFEAVLQAPGCGTTAA